ncbi:hypothetical protein COO60DRAFT_436170 [Scenedesmus sp. NREL 46B-D3]|nr:hypothetical protein COO60DRAFT_436170 [Scenedesmus sp. NREL 46B-D3]
MFAINLPASRCSSASVLMLAAALIGASAAARTAMSYLAVLLSSTAFKEATHIKRQHDCGRRCGDIALHPKQQQGLGACQYLYACAAMRDILAVPVQRMVAGRGGARRIALQKLQARQAMSRICRLHLTVRADKPW